MAKQDMFFFENLISAADSSCKAAEFLIECLTNYDFAKIEEMLQKMHEYEHKGDTCRHEMSNALAKAFVTPVDREDLALISHNIDDVTDSIEDILQSFYLNHITVVLPDVLTFAEYLLESCQIMKTLLCEFVHFKKSDALHKEIIKLNDMEEECDKLYLKARFALKDSVADVYEKMAWREIYNKMEKCADSCEHVGDCVGTVVMKNS